MCVYTIHHTTTTGRNWCRYLFEDCIQKSAVWQTSAEMLSFDDNFHKKTKVVYKHPTKQNRPAAMTTTKMTLLLLVLIQMAVCVSGGGVLSIRLLSFENRGGLTYEGECCDPTGNDDPVCGNQCDYVLRLVVSGLGRANDHVFLFHRPLQYDSNDLHFQQHGGNVTLTVLFDSWPSNGAVTLYAFFYDYDDGDHTTSLVDWFQTELLSQEPALPHPAHYQQLLTTGHRPQHKTQLALEWSRQCESSTGLQNADQGCYDHPTALPSPHNSNNDDRHSHREPASPADHTGHISKDDALQGGLQETAVHEERVGGSPFRPFKSYRKTGKKKNPAILNHPKIGAKDPLYTPVSNQGMKNARNQVEDSKRLTNNDAIPHHTSQISANRYKNPYYFKRPTLTQKDTEVTRLLETPTVKSNQRKSVSKFAFGKLLGNSSNIPTLKTQWSQKIQSVLKTMNVTSDSLTAAAAAAPGDMEHLGNTFGSKGHPGNTPGNKGHSGNTSGNKGHPGNTFGSKGHPGNTSGNKGHPGNTSGNKGHPENTPGNKGHSGNTPGNKGHPRNTSGNKGHPRKTFHGSRISQQLSAPRSVPTKYQPQIHSGKGNPRSVITHTLLSNNNIQKESSNKTTEKSSKNTPGLKRKVPGSRKQQTESKDHANVKVKLDTTQTSAHQRDTHTDPSLKRSQKSGHRPSSPNTIDSRTDARKKASISTTRSSKESNPSLPDKRITATIYTARKSRVPGVRKQGKSQISTRKSPVAQLTHSSAIPQHRTTNSPHPQTLSTTEPSLTLESTARQFKNSAPRYKTTVDATSKTTISKNEPEKPRRTYPLVQTTPQSASTVHVHSPAADSASNSPDSKLNNLPVQQSIRKPNSVSQEKLVTRSSTSKNLPPKQGHDTSLHTSMSHSVKFSTTPATNRETTMSVGQTARQSASKKEESTTAHTQKPHVSLSLTANMKLQHATTLLPSTPQRIAVKTTASNIAHLQAPNTDSTVKPSLTKAGAFEQAKERKKQLHDSRRVTPHTAVVTFANKAKSRGQQNQPSLPLTTTKLSAINTSPHNGRTSHSPPFTSKPAALKPKENILEKTTSLQRQKAGSGLTSRSSAMSVNSRSKSAAHTQQTRGQETNGISPASRNPTSSTQRVINTPVRPAVFTLIPKQILQLFTALGRQNAGDRSRTSPVLIPSSSQRHTEDSTAKPMNEGVSVTRGRNNFKLVSTALTTKDTKAINAFQNVFLQLNKTIANAFKSQKVLRLPEITSTPMSDIKLADSSNFRPITTSSSKANTSKPDISLIVYSNFTSTSFNMSSNSSNRKEFAVKVTENTATFPSSLDTSVHQTSPLRIQHSTSAPSIDSRRQGEGRKTIARANSSTLSVHRSTEAAAPGQPLSSLLQPWTASSDTPSAPLKQAQARVTPGSGFVAESTAAEEGKRTLSSAAPTTIKSNHATFPAAISNRSMTHISKAFTSKTANTSSALHISSATTAASPSIQHPSEFPLIKTSLFTKNLLPENSNLLTDVLLRKIHNLTSSLSKLRLNLSGQDEQQTTTSAGNVTAKLQPPGNVRHAATSTGTQKTVSASPTQETPVLSPLPFSISALLSRALTTSTGHEHQTHVPGVHTFPTSTLSNQSSGVTANASLDDRSRAQGITTVSTPSQALTANVSSFTDKAKLSSNSSSPTADLAMNTQSASPSSRTTRKMSSSNSHKHNITAAASFEPNQTTLLVKTSEELAITPLPTADKTVVSSENANSPKKLSFNILKVFEAFANFKRKQASKHKLAPAPADTDSSSLDKLSSLTSAAAASKPKLKPANKMENRTVSLILPTSEKNVVFNSTQMSTNEIPGDRTTTNNHINNDTLKPAPTNPPTLTTAQTQKATKATSSRLTTKHVPTATTRPAKSKLPTLHTKTQTINTDIWNVVKHFKLFPKHLATDVEQNSELGPKVLVPKKGLYVPQLVYHEDGNSLNSSTLSEGGSRVWYGTAVRSRSEGHLSRLHKTELSVQRVFSRYWPAILGVTVGTVFLVVAVLTSIACRQQRLLAQRRRRWQQDSPHHVTTPPPSSGLQSPSTTSVSS